MRLQHLDGFDPSSLRQGDEVNLLVGRPRDRDIELILGPIFPEDLFLLAPPNLTWPHLLAHLGCFPSVSQATKNWRSQGKGLEIAEGYTELTVGKARRIWIYVLKELQEIEVV